MDKQIKTLFTKDIEEQFFERFAIRGKQAELLDGFENYVYLYSMGDKSLVLRISHSIHRTHREIQGEVEFLNYLRGRGLRVSEPLPSPRGNWIETIPVEQGNFSAVCFNKAPGGEPGEEEWNETLYQKMGLLQAELHNAAREFPGFSSQGHRPLWSRELQKSRELYLPKDQPLVGERLSVIMEKLEALPRNREEYGLCHLDFHGGNFFTHQGDITLFDFDDCQEFWYTGDMAITLFYMLIPWDGGDMDPQWGRFFFQEYLKGYRQVGKVNEDLLQMVPDFLTLREIDLYMAILRSFPRWEQGPRDVQAFMKGRRERIEQGLALLEMI